MRRRRTPSSSRGCARRSRGGRGPCPRRSTTRAARRGWRRSPSPRRAVGRRRRGPAPAGAQRGDAEATGRPDVTSEAEGRRVAEAMLERAAEAERRRAVDPPIDPRRHIPSQMRRRPVRHADGGGAAVRQRGVPCRATTWKDSRATPPSIRRTPRRARAEGTLNATPTAGRASHQRAERSRRSPPPVGLATRHVASRVTSARTPSAPSASGRSASGALEHRGVHLDEPAANRRDLDARGSALAGSSDSRRRAARDPPGSGGRRREAQPISDDPIPGPREAVDAHEIVQRFAGVVPCAQRLDLVALQELRGAKDLHAWRSAGSARPPRAPAARRRPFAAAASAGRPARAAVRPQPGTRLRGGDQSFGVAEWRRAAASAACSGFGRQPSGIVGAAGRPTLRARMARSAERGATSARTPTTRARIRPSPSSETAGRPGRGRRPRRR